MTIPSNQVDFHFKFNSDNSGFSLEVDNSGQSMTGVVKGVLDTRIQQILQNEFGQDERDVVVKGIERVLYATCKKSCYESNYRNGYLTDEVKRQLTNRINAYFSKVLEREISRSQTLASSSSSTSSSSTSSTPATGGPSTPASNSSALTVFRYPNPNLSTSSSSTNPTPIQVPRTPNVKPGLINRITERIKSIEDAVGRGMFGVQDFDPPASTGLSLRDMELRTDREVYTDRGELDAIRLNKKFTELLRVEDFRDQHGSPIEEIPESKTIPRISESKVKPYDKIAKAQEKRQHKFMTDALKKLHRVVVKFKLTGNLPEIRLIPQTPMILHGYEAPGKSLSQKNLEIVDSICKLWLDELDSEGYRFGAWSPLNSVLREAHLRKLTVISEPESKISEIKKSSPEGKIAEVKKSSPEAKILEIKKSSLESKVSEVKRVAVDDYKEKERLLNEAMIEWDELDRKNLYKGDFHELNDHLARILQEKGEDRITIIHTLQSLRGTDPAVFVAQVLHHILQPGFITGETWRTLDDISNDFMQLNDTFLLDMPKVVSYVSDKIPKFIDSNPLEWMGFYKISYELKQRCVAALASTDNQLKRQEGAFYKLYAAVALQKDLEGLNPEQMQKILKYGSDQLNSREVPYDHTLVGGNRASGEMQSREWTFFNQLEAINPVKAIEVILSQSSFDIDYTRMSIVQDKARSILKRVENLEKEHQQGIDAGRQAEELTKLAEQLVLAKKLVDELKILLKRASRGEGIFNPSPIGSFGTWGEPRYNDIPEFERWGRIDKLLEMCRYLEDWERSRASSSSTSTSTSSSSTSSTSSSSTSLSLDDEG